MGKGLIRKIKQEERKEGQLPLEKGSQKFLTG
jgi:hypothetical protein